MGQDIFPLTLLILISASVSGLHHQTRSYQQIMGRRKNNYFADKQVA